ncbi:hypothetical protein HDV04_003124 [Boothiomyces sp. JEL0838]|nr:hypothetical protein HDV04_003124 [Boothiomyces sp. JEL0838]
MKVLFFAGAKDVTNSSFAEVPQVQSVPELVEQLVALYPQLSPILPTCMLAVNLEYVELSGKDADGNEIRLKETDEIALIPPVSGEMKFFSNLPDNQHVPFQKLDENPHVKTVVSFFRPRDYLNIGLFGTGFPAAFYLWERSSPSCHPRLLPRIMMVQVPFFMLAGFMYSYQNVLCGYLKQRNLDFLRRLQLKTILSLTPHQPKLEEFCTKESINHIHIKIDKPKENVPLNFQKVYQILMILIDPSYYPIYVHCLDGAVVTMVTIMCLRKLQGWPADSYLSEAQRFLKEDELSSEEVEFVVKFNGDFEIPANLVPRLPKWVFAIVNPKKHPTMKVRLGTIQPEPSLLDLNVLRSSFSNTNLLPPSRLPSTSERGSILDDKIYNDPEEGGQTPKRQSTYESRLEFEQEARVSRTIMALDLEFGRN